ncbi:transposase/predicted transcriptional regulator [Variovorax boronicumulans]|uniref:Transposase/predicted transcriptional regulator n=1 Tax=Variovorax boronicumulans TaxID=436515 RepID=A0AAW8DU90_9BURK|nr:IS1182 family transposase [Variovorax boronicumulans]MDP9877829.1 transposase/predicted transcriptional regulator [Variovorax boronicumulans]MDP9923113.1 transposase/predicted transcriptional regulator [Variovorax boronicumulans]
MAANYRPYDPQQMMLLPETLQEWLPEGHLAHFISDAIDGFDLGAFHGRYDKGDPRIQPFHPAMMVKVLVYGYATGVLSSRKIARKLHEDVAFRVLAARNFPAHRTIRDFCAFHLKELSELFVQVVRLAREMGLVKLGTIAVDGTKVKANASRHKAMNYGHMLKSEAELKAQIDALLNKARAADEAEKNEAELDIPAEIARRQDRLDAIAAARARLEQRQREADLERGRSHDDDQMPCGKDGKLRGERYKRPFGVPQDKDQDNFTDPDSRIMQRAGGGFDAAYNAQTAVDDTAHIIVAAELINNASDVRELPTMLAAVKDTLGAYPEQTLADAGYRSEAVFAALTGCTDLVVTIERDGKEHRAIDEASLPLTAAMAAKMKTHEAREAYRRRKWLAEPPNGWIKNVLGLRQFSMRGLHRVQAEWKLVCMALNLRRMVAMQAA